MEKKNPNIYQRALDIVNNRINPDIPQGGGGGSSDAVQYIPQELTEEQQMQARKNQGLYYEEDTVGYLIEEATRTFDEEHAFFPLDFVAPIVEGEIYNLVRDGVEYEVTAKPYGGGMYVYVGCSPEGEIAEDDPKVCIVSAESLGEIMIIDFELGTHTYTLEGAMHVVSAIDKKYVMPVIDDYMTLMQPASELIINWDGDMSERETIWDEDHGWVKIADDFPNNSAWINLAIFKYGHLYEGGSWSTKVVSYGHNLIFGGDAYVLGESNLIFVCGESFTPPEIGCTLTHGVWVLVFEDADEDRIDAYHEIVFPEVVAPMSRFAGRSGVGNKSFVCAFGAAGATSGYGAINCGDECEVSGDFSTAFGQHNKVLGIGSFASGYGNTVEGHYSIAEGQRNIVGGSLAHVEGECNESQFAYQHIEGKYADTYHMEMVGWFDVSKTYHPGDVVLYQKPFGARELNYCIKECTGKSPADRDGDVYWALGYNPLVHVVGWGPRASDGTITTKNIHTLDSLGNAMYTGDVTAKSMIIQSSTPDSTKKFKITVDDTGAITATEVT